APDRENVADKMTAGDGLADGVAVKEESGAAEAGVTFEVGRHDHAFRDEPTFDGIDDLIYQGSLIDTSAWSGGGSGYRPDKKKRKKKKRNI
ncbi:MAG: hypothetical protein K2H70_05790, partial [Bacteroidales bacterium]|nr:hypothetical protein [Bacteroidales bacterium]